MAVPYISSVASLIGDPTRAYRLCALKQEEVLKASELAEIAGVARNTASEHLAKLRHGGLVACESDGRNRYYRLAGAEVADALEALEYLSIAVLPRDRLIPGIENELRYARLCYDHLGGQLAVKLTSALQAEGDLLVRKEEYSLSRRGESKFARLGIDVQSIRRGRRRFARRCADWTEAQPHLGGALGAAFFGRLQALDWLSVNRNTLQVKLTSSGRRELPAQLSIPGLDITGSSEL